jgi:hypothetical protein
VRFDINGKTPTARTRRAKQYKDGIRRRIKRAKDIEPLTYYDTPVTPAPNPENPKIGNDAKSGHSYHVIELVDGGGNSGMRVQLLICDYNQYLVAFRRQRDRVWSAWYHWSDWPLPDYFNGVSLEITGDHKIK